MQFTRITEDLFLLTVGNEAVLVKEEEIWQVGFQMRVAYKEKQNG